MKKIFRKKIFAFFLSALLVLALSLPVFADMGPKPSVTLKLYYTPGQRYAVTLLGNTALDGHWTAGTTPPPSATTFWAIFRNTPAMPMQSSSGATTRPTSSMFCSII